MQQGTTSLPYRLVYSLGRHPYLGFLIEPHIVHLNQNGSYSLSYKRVFSNTVDEFAAALDDLDYKLIKLLDEIEQTHIIKQFHKKAIRPADYFSKIFDQNIYDYIRPKIEQRMLSFLNQVGDKPLFLMSKDGYPAEQELQIAPKTTSILFHFRRNDNETRYFPTLKYDGHRMEFMYKDAEVIVNQQAWLLLDNTLYHFDEELEGKKLTPFLNKRFISIPRNTEKKYFETFVTGLIEKHHVYAEGLDIITYKENASPELRIIYSPEGEAQLQLYFQYGDYTFPAGGNHAITVKYVHQPETDSHKFYRIKRSTAWEEKREALLEQLGLQKADALFSTFKPKDIGLGFNPSAIEWVNEHLAELEQEGFHITQSHKEKRFLIGKTSISIEIAEENDWFDVKAIVRFGPYEIPFTSLRQHIINKQQEFELPNGEIAIIPQEWFSQYEHLFQFSSKKDEIRLNRVHIGLINDVSEHTEVTMQRKLNKLGEFDEIADIEAPKKFKGSLRPYQKAGYNWFHFLQEYRFGGLLADDMGLGKTVQTLALLQHQKELLGPNDAKTSLLIVPTSLIFNWQKEAERFVPNLRVHLHTGGSRSKDNFAFSHFDLIITTYGIARIDEELLSGFFFNYIILDESQNIKNPRSKSFSSIKQLKSKHKLALSGTPIENSVLDIWSQMHFANPGLLGSFTYFQKEFVQAIEKKKDEEKARRLQAIIKPFVLRRTKSQVATELPPKSEQIFYCSMSDEQLEYYERVKSEYRNALLDGAFSGKASQIALLQGLTKLRQLANHPSMIDQGYDGGSGKFDAAIELMESIIKEGNKVLIFSQFVKHLQLFRDHFDKEKIRYAYLDGSTSDRNAAVKAFKENEDIQVFLISIKAGGVGLNLTEADYVFILDPWWNPAVEQQAIDRSHRIGQVKNVFIYKFISKDSIEEKILALQGMKKSLASSLITTEESFVKSLSKEDISELFS
ncbi:DEAD/DEAH box helicase [Sphingobacterium sp. UBA6645]|uniref:DEAD/DEAH box helicase n=1 Tax=Sphingobacterium sp. UBA6645 TaxID=1947511 RepID=UPI0025EC2DFB|nr:DEAD/DEAH box helicase [Sphingobacterium sp. UBA6645]